LTSNVFGRGFNSHRLHQHYYFIFLNFVGFNLFTSKGTHDGRLSQENLPPLTVVESMIASPLSDGNVFSRSKHIERSSIGKDEKPLTVNDRNCHTHTVKNGLKRRLGLKAQ